MIPNPRSNPNSCFPNNHQHQKQQQQQQQQMYGTNSGTTNVTNPSVDSTSSGSNDHRNSLLYNLSLLKEKFHQVQSLVMIMPQQQLNDSNCASLTTFIQEIIVAASSMIFTCQQMDIGNNNNKNNNNNNNNTQFQNQPQIQSTRLQDDSLYHEPGPSGASMDWYEEEYNNNTNPNLPGQGNDETVQFQQTCRKNTGTGDCDYDVIELNAVDLLAKYTHYCQVCGKGFKRDANLRMHMRAHGDEYKSAAALSNPTKRLKADLDKHTAAAARKYSCPQEGCRWNSGHEKFQPLKSMICAKNHYKRSHCPKMYVCKRCSRKQFSVLSDLRTHEKHCGDLKWQCTCGTTFSRKDKLMGHVGLFVGHAPMVASNNVAKRIKKGASSSFITI